MLWLRAACQLAAVAAVAVAVVGVAGATMSASGGEARLRRTLDSVHAALRFMGGNVEFANLDGGIGVRTVEGQFGALLARYWTELPSWAAARLRELQLLAARVGDAVAESVQRRTPAYYHSAGQMVHAHSWDMFYPTRRLLPATQPQAAAAAAPRSFTEKFSDDCVRQFYAGRRHAACTISPSCWKTMVETPNARGYFLTHQLFYLQNGVQANCAGNLSAAAGGDSLSPRPLLSRMDAICSSVFAEALELERRGFPLGDRDLFMEQIGMCGLSGYTRVAQWRWWRLVTGWQRRSGCYGSFAHEVVAGANFAAGRYGSYRRKRAESAMSAGGCLSHRTSVALDALVTYVRRLVEEALLQRQRQ